MSAREQGDERALWQRFRASTVAGARPDAMSLAAYADSRPADEAAEAIEAYLAQDLDLLDDILAARQAGASEAAACPPALLARAMHLVPERDAKLLSFPRAAAQVRWRAVASWSSMAASAMIAGYIGFTLGADTYVSLARNPSLGIELLDPPAGILTGIDEDSAT
jgi:hypothetical protein